MIKKKRYLFVCACNLNRSSTFEKFFIEHQPIFEVKSAGIYGGGTTQFNKELAKWADKIFVMDLSQAKFIFDKYKEYYNKVQVIGVSDQYDRDSEELINLIKFWIEHGDIK